MTPEFHIKKALLSMNELAKNLMSAHAEYVARNDDSKADKQNAKNVRDAIKLINQSYDCISEIVENDLDLL